MSATAIAIHEPEAPAILEMLRPIATPAEVLKVQNETRALIAQALASDRDYGIIPGTNKPTLLKPGAERVAIAFGCYYGDPEILEREINHDRETEWSKPRQNRVGTSRGLYRYVVRVRVINRATGTPVGFGIGACSSMEAKYVENPRDAENTILKMAHKRAIVSAALATFGLSDQFTQDMEDAEPTAAASAPATTTPKNGTITPTCPKCKGPTFDNSEARARNSRAPLYKCANRSCDGAVWPPKTPKAKAAVSTDLGDAYRDDDAPPPDDTQALPF